MYRITLILSNRFIVLTVHADFTGILNPNQIEKIREWIKIVKAIIWKIALKQIAQIPIQMKMMKMKRFLKVNKINKIQKMKKWLFKLVSTSIQLTPLV